MGFDVGKMMPRRLQRSIQTKLFVMLFLLGAVSLSALVGSSIWLGKSEIQSEVSKRNQEIASLVSSQVEAHLSNIIFNLTLEADTLTEIERNPGAGNLNMRFFQLAANNDYHSLTRLDKSGMRRPLLEGNFTSINQHPEITPVQPSNDFSNHPAYLTTKAGQTFFSPIDLRGPDNLTIGFVGVPLRTETDEFNGTLIAEIDLNQMLQIVNSISLGKSTTVMIVDERGKKLASSDTNGIGQLVQEDKLNSVYNKRTGQASYKEDGQTYLAGYAPVKGRNGWGVIVTESEAEASAGIYRLGLIAIVMAIVLMVVTSIVGVLVSKGITRPVRELAIAANRITTTGNLDEQIPITSQDEVGELTASFNGMILALRKTRMALEHWNRELEHKVELRTQEQAQVNNKLEQTNLQLERANLHKSQFLANMSHELRTPLNAIIGFSEVLQDEVFGNLNDKQKRYVNNILTSGRHLLNLVNDVLDLSKVEAGKMELHWEEFSAGSAVYEVQSELSTLAEQKDLQLSVQVSEALERIMADRARFRQILFNLLSNAIKFTPPGGQINISGTVQKGAKPESSMVARFAVKDTGIGISADNLSYIFESFRQVDNSYSRLYQGTGLGLALTKKLVEMHGGSILVESEPGVGSNFIFTIPLITSVIVKSNPVGLLAGVGAADSGSEGLPVRK